jgi:lipoteichoic acid synthase
MIGWIRNKLSPHQRVFVFGLVGPLLTLHLVLKTIRVVERGSYSGVLGLVDLYKSELFFHLGFAFVGFGLLAMSRNLWVRRAMLLALQVFAGVVAILEISAHQFFVSTGSTLDSYLIAFSLSQFEETRAVISSEVPMGAMVFLVGTVIALLAAPWALLGVKRKRGDTWEPVTIRRRTALGSYVFGLLLLLLAALPPFSEPYVSFARATAVNMTMSLAEMLGEYEIAEGGRMPLTGIYLEPRYEDPRKKHIAFIILESTRARSVTVYNESLHTTPWLAELAKESLVAERAYAIVPHTSKALVALLCGIEPRLNMPITESLPDAIPTRCLADLLDEQGYATAFFQSATEHFEGRRQLVRNMGYEFFQPLNEMDTSGFDKANYFGYEDDIMLEPSRQWLEGVTDRPVFATYLTLTPHHDYLAPRRYGHFDFDEDEELNNYLNTIRYMDHFLQNLMDQYRELGLYDDTIFVIVGDHGEGFGEHGRRQHDNVIYEEGIHIPLMIYEPGKPRRERITGPVSQIDIVPTLTEMLGYEILGGKLPGVDMRKTTDRRTVFAHCWYERRCMASVTGTDKYIHHFNRQPDEFFDLAVDPLELDDLAPMRTDLGLRRMELMAWRQMVNGMYQRHNQEKLDQFIFQVEPPMEYRVDAQFVPVNQPVVRLLGYDLSAKQVRPGQRLTVTYYFEALRPVPADWKLFVHGQGPGGMINLDHVPVSGLYPLEDWKPGEIIADVQEVRIPPAWEAGTFTLYLGLWHADEGRAQIAGEVEQDAHRRARLFQIPVIRR